MPVQRALRVAGGGGDLVDARLLVAAVGEDTQSCREELPASLAALRPRGGGAPVETRCALPSPPRFYGSGDRGNIPTDRSVCTGSMSSPDRTPAARGSSCSSTSRCPTAASTCLRCCIRCRSGPGGLHPAGRTAPP